MTRAEQWRIVLRVVAAVLPVAVLFGLVLGYFLGEGNARSVVSGGLIGGLLALATVTFDVSWAVGLISRRWRESPFLVILITRSLVWLAIIVVGISVPLLAVAEVPSDELINAEMGWTVAATFAFALVINFTLLLARLLGPGVLPSLLLGRYHRPREEVRIFLLVDLRGSSGIAEQLGNLRYHAFLKRFIADISSSAIRFGGEIHRYVGDEVIVTWKQERGLRDGACLAAVLGMQDQLSSANPDYLRDFGIAPDIWAGVHMGPVVTGEVGTVKHEIVYLGDTLNVAARIEQACRDLDRTILASATVVDAVQPPQGMLTESLGAIELRGIGEPLELFAISHSR